MNKQIKTVDSAENLHKLTGIFRIIDGGIIPEAPCLVEKEPMILSKDKKLYALVEK